MIDDPNLTLLNDCLAGKPKALEDLIKIFQPKVFALSLKFLWDPDEAEDATQEILIKIITHLAGFRKESKLSTWVYRVATNHLINIKKSKSESRTIRFHTVERELKKSNATPESEPENLPYLVHNIQGACTHAMLLCLTRPYRIAYLLGEVFQVTNEEGSWILEISNELYRKRLSRARKQMDEFLGKQCGLTNANNPCSCKNRIQYVSKRGRINQYLELSESLRNSGAHKKLQPMMPEVRTIRKAAEVFRNGPEFRPRNQNLEMIQNLIKNKNSKIFN
ncbi:RNA polymerase sigma factor [Leptospira sp. 96542]|nr:RNA polymerase sigma factor [Leptospira sp. 96542]